MIIIKLQGGLGNQLFQWAFGYSLFKKFGMDLSFDLSWYDTEQHASVATTKREFLLDNLLKFPLPRSSDKTITSPLQHINDTEHFMELTLDPSASYYFNGYWQSEKYIKRYRSDIINSLNLDVEHDFDFTGSCSIHVRRGDYVNNPHHPVLPLSYYEKSLEIIKPKGYTYVFSDDMDWCKKNFSFDKMIFMEGNSNIEDLKLMSLCSHNIIANSSFSWWGAWLNQHPLKKVFTPAVWFPSGPDCKDLIPPEWTLMR